MFENAKISALVALSVVPYYLLLLLLLAVGKWFFDLSYRQFRLNAQMVKEDNPAVALMLVGYLLALALALVACLQDLGSDWQENMLNLLLNGVAVLILLRLSLLVQDKFILFRFSLLDELLSKRNSAVGIVCCGCLIGNGLVLAGVMVGNSQSQALVFLDLALYWLLGQVIFIVAGFFYQSLTPYDFHDIIGKQKNIAAALALAGFFIATGLIVQSSISGGSGAFLMELITTIVLTAAGFLLLLISRQIVDYVFLPGSPLRNEIVIDRNIGAGLVLAIFYIVSALIFSSTLQALVS